MRILLILAGVLVVLVLLGWLGLRIKPRSFPAFPQQAKELGPIPLPEGLPAPVERFFRQVYGETVPVVESFVVSGRARMRIMGITFPARFRFTHIAGQDYRHYIETTFFGLALMLLVGVGQPFFEVNYLQAPLASLGMTLTLSLWAASLGLLIGALAQKEEQVIT